jgi:hypothetical protein
MNSKLRNYAIQQLAATGFAFLESGIAFKLRPDMWSVPLNCACDMGIGQDDEAELMRMGASLFFANVIGRTAALRGCARSLRDIENRIEFVTGLVVASVVTVETFSEKTKIEPPIKTNEITEIQKLAAKELPVHNCPLRSQILNARQKLAEKGA